MLVGFDSEFGFRSIRTIGSKLEPDTTTGVPVCACLAFEDGRELVFAEDYAPLAAILSDPTYTFVVHGAHAEMQFCRMVGIPFPKKYIDTLLRGVLLAHAATFEPFKGAYGQAGLATLTSRFGIPFIGSDEKDIIRDSIVQLRHLEEFGLKAVTDYCMADARACLQLARPLTEELIRVCGPNVERNLASLYQPYAQIMATVAAKGLRFDMDGWERLSNLADEQRERHLRVMRQFGYAHDGVGLGITSFEAMLVRIGLDRNWPRTPKGRPRTQESDLKDRRHLHQAIQATYKLLQFDAIMNQRLGERVDRDGRLRCGILPFAQRSSRNSTIRPNLMGTATCPGDARLPIRGSRDLGLACDTKRKNETWGVGGAYRRIPVRRSACRDDRAAAPDHSPRPGQTAGMPAYFERTDCRRQKEHLRDSDYLPDGTLNNGRRQVGHAT